jgi:mannose/fructose-specific phosphotransferase system component IIA
MTDFRIVVAAHGPLAHAMVSAAELICGTIPQVTAVALEPGSRPEDFADRLRTVLGADDRPVLVLADLFGATPANAARVAARGRPATWIIANATLATLLEAVVAVDELTEEAVARLAAQGGPRVLAPAVGGMP